MSGTHKNIELLTGEKLLLESEGWAIIQDPGNNHRTELVYASHETCTVSYDPTGNLPDDKYYYGDYCWVTKEDPTCKHCEASVPDGIQAIIHLRNWGLKGET
jgi:hypothetical protein